MENGPFENVFPIKHVDIPASYVSLPEGNHFLSNLDYKFIDITISPSQTFQPEILRTHMYTIVYCIHVAWKSNHHFL